MKKILSILALSTALLSFSQQNVELRITHKLGNENFSGEVVAQNNLGNDFKLTRLQYYVSRISVIHDGGQNTIIPDEVIALINCFEDGASTSIPLGSLAITTVEKVKLHIGVYSPINNADPALQEMGHPLAPQNPNMHWGWASGYRFVALEGLGGNGFSQTFQMHGLGNDNYFETTVDADAEMQDGKLIIDIEGDYTEALKDIVVNNGVISHGEAGEARDVLLNFNNNVFSDGELFSASTNELSVIETSVYPIPSNGLVNITVSKTVDLEVINALGKTVDKIVGFNSSAINLEEKGIYFIKLSENETVLKTQKIIIR